MTVKVVLLAMAVLAAVVVVALAWSLVANRAVLFAPPGWQARLSTYLASNVAATRADHRFPELRTPVFASPVQRLAGAVTTSLDELGWEVTEAGADGTRWQAVVRTPLIGFRDDLTIALTGRADGSTAMEVRSQSRVGRGDLGANRAHVLALVRAVERRLGQARQP